MTHEANIFETIAKRADHCAQLVTDIDLIRPQTYEADLPMQKVMDIINGAAQLYELRFEALFEAYSEAVSKGGFSHYPIEECVMQWWGACDDMRCAVEAIEASVLDKDGIDNILLGVRSMSVVRAARFGVLFKAARSAEKAESQETAKKEKKSKEKKKVRSPGDVAERKARAELRIQGAG